jgi:hypothetical protein
MEKRIEQEDVPMPNLFNHIKYYTFSITNSMKKFVGQIRRENANFVLPQTVQPILLFKNIDVSIIKIYLDTFVLAKSNMGRREYVIYSIVGPTISKFGITYVVESLLLYLTLYTNFCQIWQW